MPSTRNHLRSASEAYSRNAALAGGATSYVVLVRDCTKFPGTEKYYDGKPGMKIISVIEVNDINPLNVMGFTLKEAASSSSTLWYCSRPTSTTTPRQAAYM